MSIKGRNKSEDRKMTLEKLKDRTKHPNIDGRNWLGHKEHSGAAKIDLMLLDGAPKKEMRRARGAVPNHLRHLKEVHGLTVVQNGDIFRLV